MKKTGTILILCIIFLLTACSRGGNSGESDMQEESSAVNTVSGAKGAEWVYVPEIIDVRDKRADYGDMQLIGDTLCYITINGEDVDGLQLPVTILSMQKNGKLSLLTGRRKEHSGKRVLILLTEI